MKFSLLRNMKMPTIVEKFYAQLCLARKAFQLLIILRFTDRTITTNFMLSRVEHEKSFISSELGLHSKLITSLELFSQTILRL